MNRPQQPRARRLSTIALVTPSFNTAPYLEQTLQSVLLQNYPALEYVVVDGGSTDGSVEILDAYRSRLTALIIEPDRGHADALNKGFSRTSGEIMGWINSDDLLHRNALATVDAVFAAFPDVEWITGIPTRADSDSEGRVTGFRIKAGRRFTHKDFLSGDFRWLQQESTFWRRSLWERAGGRLDTALLLAVDFELWMRFFRHSRLHTVEALIGAFRGREGQRSAVMLDEYLVEAEGVIAREAEMLASGTLSAPSVGPDRRARGSLRSRLLSRFDNDRSWPEISREQVEDAMLHRWSESLRAFQEPL